MKSSETIKTKALVNVVVHIRLDGGSRLWLARPGRRVEELDPGVTAVVRQSKSYLRPVRGAVGAYYRPPRGGIGITYILGLY